jgi:hypothetical protein
MELTQKSLEEYILNLESE